MQLMQKRKQQATNICFIAGKPSEPISENNYEYSPKKEPKFSITNPGRTLLTLAQAENILTIIQQ